MFVTVTVNQGYLARLVALAKKQNVPGLGLRSDLVDLIDLLRVSSVEVVEAIVKWRRGLVGGVSIFLPSETPRTLASSHGFSDVLCGATSTPELRDVSLPPTPPCSSTHTHVRPPPHPSHAAACFGQVDPRQPFLWNAANYLLKMEVDSSFLDRLPQLVQWFGFRLSRNPFFIPVTLEQDRAKQREEAARQAQLDGVCSSA